jgi:hypothetical protein
MSKLADLMEAKREEIARRYTARLDERLAATALDAAAVADSVREFVDELVAGLRREVGRGEAHTPDAPRSPTAAEHGGQRFGLGFDLGSLVRDYGSLRDVLFQVVEESGQTPSVSELRVLSKYLIGGIADAATAYAALRDEEMRRQAAKHIGFLAHELRNPLASVRLAFSLLDKRGLLPRPNRTVESIDRGLTRVEALIDGALVGVKLRAGAELVVEEVDLQALLVALAEESTAEAEAKGVRVVVHGAPARLCVDVRLLTSALSNLVRNAVKFTREAGTIQLRLRSTEHRVTVEIEDECGGLPPGRVESLFDPFVPFVQAGHDRSGFGLGLAIAKQAVEAHAGALRVHDLPGRGCVFVLDLPLDPALPRSPARGGRG